MPGMFDNYIIPSNKNTHCKPNFKPNNLPSRPNKPFESYDENGNVVGYWWYEGDTVTLDFSIGGEVTIDQEIIEVINGETITKNIPVYVPINDFIKDKTITFNMYNFRGEVVLTQDFEGSTKVLFEIDQEMASILTKGTYTISLLLWNGESFNKTIYSKEDCIITIK